MLWCLISDHIQNTSFSSKRMNEPVRLKFCFTLVWKGKLRTNTPAYWANAYFMKKMRCCECKNTNGRFLSSCGMKSGTQGVLQLHMAIVATLLRPPWPVPMGLKKTPYLINSDSTMRLQIFLVWPCGFRHSLPKNDLKMLVLSFAIVSHHLNLLLIQ